MLSPQEMVKTATLQEDLRAAKHRREDGLDVHYPQPKSQGVLRILATLACVAGIFWSVSHLI